MANVLEISQLPGMSAMAAPLSALTNISIEDGSPPPPAHSASPKAAPRRESKDVARGMLSKHPRAAARGVVPVGGATSASLSAGAASNNASTTGLTGSTTPGNNSGNAPEDHQRAAMAPGAYEPFEPDRTLHRPKSKRWNLIKKDVLPNPLLMEISERVQLIIKYGASLSLSLALNVVTNAWEGTDW